VQFARATFNVDINAYAYIYIGCNRLRADVKKKKTEPVCNNLKAKKKKSKIRMNALVCVFCFWCCGVKEGFLFCFCVAV